MTMPGPDHERWADAVGSYLLDALPPEEREGFAAHLEACPVCRRDVEELAVAVEALPLSVPSVAPPATLKDRIMTVVESEAELLAAAGQGADRPARTPARRRGFLGGWLLRPGLALACAAVLLVAGGLAGALLAGGSPESRTVVAQTTAPGADVRLEIRDDASTLVARGMPAPPGDRIYQVWIKRPGRDPEPTSVLWSTRGDGSAEVAVPGSLEGVEAVLVTDEPQGGSDAPTAEPVITAATA
jgi:anti-sigma-K factor RskA